MAKCKECRLTPFRIFKTVLLHLTHCFGSDYFRTHKPIVINMTKSQLYQ